MKTMDFPKRRKLVLIVGMLVVAAGCSTTRVPPGSDTEAYAERLLAEKVSVAASAQRDYARLVNEHKAVVDSKRSSFDVDEVDVDYIGKPEALLQAFAHRYGYRYVETGPRRDIRTINVRMQKVPPVEVLRNVGYQIDSAADVELDKADGVLRLIYKPQDKRG